MAVTTPFATIEEAVEDVRAGRFVVVVDDPDRENEGDLVIAAQFATPETVNFMATHGRGLICLCLTEERADRIGLRPMTERNEAPLGTAFTITFEAREGVTTGISAADRARTLRVAASPAAGAQELVCPGHIPVVTPLAEDVPTPAAAALTLCREAGAWTAAALCHVLGPQGEVATATQLRALADELGVPFVTADEVQLPANGRKRHSPIEHALMSIGA
jgi:3,4-dihydroxy 2-butanone 4-phosphate synthase / GTP cyclohydrolase II